MNRNTIIKHNKFMNNQNYGQRSDGKTGLYIVIAIMAVLLIGGSIGATLFLFSKGVSEEELLAKVESKLQEKEKVAGAVETEVPCGDGEYEESAANQKIIVKKHAKNAAAHRAASAGGSNNTGNYKAIKVVIDGHGVRLRFAPSLNAGYLTWENGATRSPNKGARLDYKGETDDWYQVEYKGYLFYVSKEFSYLEY
jgi:hypothetical protein